MLSPSGYWKEHKITHLYQHVVLELYLVAPGLFQYHGRGALVRPVFHVKVECRITNPGVQSAGS